VSFEDGTVGNTQQILLGLSSVFLLGTAAQWLAWRVHVPSVVILLVVGFVAGPITGFLQPDRILGELLFPLVSLAVALILFEGGLNLRFAELRGVGRVLWKLVTEGALITWVLSAAGAWYLLDFTPTIAALLGAILVVSGPTVVGPLLRHIRPIGPAGPLAKWEGIIIDPVGATLAVLVFEAIPVVQAETASNLLAHAAWGLFRTIAIGGAFGVVGAVPLGMLLKRYWIPDYLQAPVTFAAVVAAFTAANHVQHESGLLAVTLMGVILANQRGLTVRHIIQFKEDLSILLISALFILLAARVKLEDFSSLGWWSLAFLAYLMLIVRPLAVFCSALGSKLSLPERLFLAWLAPRGIVAAAVASVFAFQLGPEGRDLVSATFFVIVGTVLIYGLTTPLLARRLKVALVDPQGVLIAGAYAGARAIAHALQQQGIAVLLVDTNRENINTARLEGLPSEYGSILSETDMDQLNLGGLGRLLALTSNDEVNSLAALHFTDEFGRASVFQLAPRKESAGDADEKRRHLRGRILFGPQVNYDELEQRFSAGGAVKATSLTDEFDYDAYRAHYGGKALAMFAIRDGRLIVSTADDAHRPKPGQTLISLVNEAGESTPLSPPAPAIAAGQGEVRQAE
jgi:NhaP-type Na+/H+ or K+/H+ antiporter